MHKEDNDHLLIGNLLAWHYERRREVSLELCSRYGTLDQDYSDPARIQRVKILAAWNLLHVAARDDLVLEMFGQPLIAPHLATLYDEGTPPREETPDAVIISDYLIRTRDHMAAFMRGYPPERYGERPDPKSRRTVADWFVFRVEHEAYHRGKVRALLDGLKVDS